MHKRIRSKKIKKYFRVGIIAILIFVLAWFFVGGERHKFVRSDRVKNIIINDKVKK